MTAANRILEILYDRRDMSVPAEELAAAGGLRPAGLARGLEELAGRGHRLERSPAGVRLVRPTVLDAHLVERDLSVKLVGKHVICFGRVESTNDVAFAALRTAPARSSRAGQTRPARAVVVTAEEQLSGRGRLGRRWYSPAGSGILASVGIADEQGLLAHEPLTIAAGLAVAEGIERAADVPAQVEWPNDVVIAGRKLAGILVEVRPGGPGRHVVIGFGVNVYAAPPEEQAPQAACLAQAAEQATKLERIEILRAILSELDRWVLEIAQPGPALEELHGRWLARCAMVNKRLSLSQAGRRVTGRVLDVHPLEGLVLEDDHGRQHVFSAATTSVVK